MTDLRAISAGDRALVAPAPQALPDLRWLALSQLRIDGRYQRPLGETNWRAIQKIAADFRWSRFSPVLVAPASEGLFAVIDGQHRVHAALLCGFSQVPAMVVAADVAAQADAFAAVNGNVVRMSPLNLYRAALAAGEGWAVRCDDVVADAGCVLRTANNSTKAKKPGEVYCVGLIRDLVTRGHADAVRAGLRAIRAHDVTGRAALYADAVLNPWLRAISAAQGWRDVDLAEVLRRNPPLGVMARADHARARGEAVGSAESVRRQGFGALIKAAAGMVQAAPPAVPSAAAPRVAVVSAPVSRPAPRAVVASSAPRPAPVVVRSDFVPDWAQGFAGVQRDYARWLAGDPGAAPWTAFHDASLAHDVWAGNGAGPVAEVLGLTAAQGIARFKAISDWLRDDHDRLRADASSIAMPVLRARAAAERALA